MAFFEHFPTTLYDSYGNGTYKVTTDITKQIKLSDVMKVDGSFFGDYIVNEGETPEIIAHKLYGHTGYHWLVLLANDIVDVFTEWPVSDSAIRKYADSKYPGIAVILSNDLQRNTRTTFPVGETVEIVHDGVTKITATIHKWDGNLFKLELKDPSSNLFAIGDVVNYYQTDLKTGAKESSPSTIGTITRIIWRNIDAIHHFETDDGRYADPHQVVQQKLTFSTPYQTGRDFIVGETVRQVSNVENWTVDSQTPTGVVVAWNPSPVGESSSVLVLEQTTGTDFVLNDSSKVVTDESSYDSDTWFSSGLNGVNKYVVTSVATNSLWSDYAFNNGNGLLNSHVVTNIQEETN
jgi:hypothetical protein